MRFRVRIIGGLLLLIIAVQALLIYTLRKQVDTRDLQNQTIWNDYVKLQKNCPGR